MLSTVALKEDTLKWLIGLNPFLEHENFIGAQQTLFDKITDGERCPALSGAK